MSEMAGMAMSDKASSMDVDMNMKTAGNVGVSSNMTSAMTSNNTIIKNVTEYQTAQSLAARALEIFNKNLSPIAPPKVAAANAQIEKDLVQLKNAIDNKVQFMGVMKLVHVQLHPALITTYNLQLKS
jgi:hypothetical protein